MSHSRLLFGSLSLLLLALVVTDVSGQERRGGRRGFGRGPGGPGFGRPGGGDPTMGLLRMDEVRSELDLSDDQKAALDKLNEMARDIRRGPPDIDRIRNMDEEERNEFFRKMREEGEKTAKEMKERLDEVLLPNQMERLDQISLQVRGVQALQDDAVKKELGISTEQLAKIEEVQRGMRDKMQERMREAFQSGDRDFEKMGQLMRELRKETEDSAMEVLSTDQRNKFAAMKGEPFKMPEGGLFARGRGGRRGGFGGRGFGGRRGDGGRRGGRGDRPGRPGRPDRPDQPEDE